MTVLGPSHDAQRFRARNRLAMVGVFVAVLVLIARLLIVQGVMGANYEKIATIERVGKVRAQAPRGQIKGADGTVLARNLESHSLELLPAKVKPERVALIVGHLRELLDMTDAEVEGLRGELLRDADPRKRQPLVARRDLVSTHCPYDSSQLELTSEVEYRFCPVCGRNFEPVPAKKSCPFDQRKLQSISTGDGMRCTSCERDFSAADQCPYDHHALHKGHHNLKCPLCQRTFNDEVAVLRANLHLLPEARLQSEIQREYPFRFLASHVLGYLGYVTDVDRAPLLPWLPPRFALTDRVGRSGLERAFDQALRGLDGEQVVVRRSGTDESAKGMDDLINGLQPRPVVPGMSLRLTLDLELQRAAKVAMKDVFSGAAVVINARSGEVLALYSKPSFDPNTMSGKRAPHGKTTSDTAAYAPLLDKAVHAFPPASTFKVVAAIAALEENVVTPATTFHCPGYYDFGGRRFHCHSKRGHGDVNLREAIRSSCDVYFYHLGEQLGLDRLEQWARKLGYGQPTGIEIHEAQGRLPTREWYAQQVKGGYYPGFALSTAVGQKDVTATPLQIARVYSALGREGQLPNVTLVQGFEGPDGKLLPRLPRVEGQDLPVKPSTLRFIRSALLAVVNDEGGTAYSSQPNNVMMAGKTGTAQAAQRPRADMIERLKADPLALGRLTTWMQNDHAWFAGYAPADDPEITVVVFVEHGGSGGHNAAPIAVKIVESWFARHPHSRDAEASKEKAHKKAAQAAEELDETPLADPEDVPTVPHDDDPANRPADESPPSGETGAEGAP
jgi:penicillin-binding protein 2